MFIFMLLVMAVFIFNCVFASILFFMLTSFNLVAQLPISNLFRYAVSDGSQS
jgi:hypothetical protein